MKKNKTGKCAGQETRPNCKDCRNTDGSYENFLTFCKVLSVKRPYGSRECFHFEKKV